MAKKAALILVFIFINLITIPGYAQQNAVTGYNYSDGQKSVIDTLYQKSVDQNTTSSIGLIDKPINPDTYILGPNDLLSLTIITAKPIDKDLLIGPGCDIMLPNVGSVNLKGLTLNQGIEIIKNKIHSVYKTNEIYVLLKDIKKFKIPVSGLVRKPATVTATSSDRISEIIERAGGIKYDASLRNITVLKNEGNDVKVDLLKFLFIRR